MCAKLFALACIIALWFGICWVWVESGFKAYRVRDRIVFTILLMVVLPLEVIWEELWTKTAEQGKEEGTHG